MVVEDPPEEKVEFEAYQFFVNDEEIQVTYNEKLKAWVIPQLTQYDKFTFKAAVKNTDDTAVYEWTRGMGANRTVIDGATTNEVRAFALYVIELLRARRYVRRYKRSARKLATYSNAPAICECATIPLAAILHF